jgi:phage baseplate assembly protein V
MISWATLDRMVAKLIAPLRRRVQLMIGRAILETINDATTMQSVKMSLLSDEVSEDVERFQEYGFTSVPFANCEAIAVFVGGSRAHGVVIATDDRTKRPTGTAEGDVALYNSNGVRVLLDDDADEVLLGNAPTNFVALANLVETELAEIKTELDNIVTTLGTGTVAAAPGPVVFGTPYVNGYTADPVAAAEVKAK